MVYLTSSCATRTPGTNAKAISEARINGMRRMGPLPFWLGRPNRHGLPQPSLIWRKAGLLNTAILHTLDRDGASVFDMCRRVQHESEPGKCRERLPVITISLVRIAIDIRRMNEFGVGTYTRNVVRMLARLDTENEYFLLGQRQKASEIGALPENFQSFQVPSSETARGYWEAHAVVRRLKCDLVHVPYLFWLPRHLPCPYVVTVHDILDHMYRARNGSGFTRSLHFHLTRRVLKNAARILAVSQFTKGEVQKLFGIDPGRIEVIYNAIDPRFLTGHATDADRQLLAERYQITYPFLLYAGRISPHKNLVRIIEAFSALRAELAKQDLYH